MLFTRTVVSSAVLALASATSTGTGTYYGGNVAGGTCSFSTYTIPSSLYGTASSGADWDSAADCGACVKVTGPSGTSITAMIVDECPECANGSLDLFSTAFSALADASLGEIAISWDFVECGITTPLSVLSKSGVSAYWFSMQVVNSNERVTSLEISTDGGSTWQTTTRSDYNFFENSSGFGTTTVDVRITGVSGDTVVINDVTVESGVSATASSNFGSGSSSTASSDSSSATAAIAAVKKAVISSSSTSDIPTSTGIKSTIYRTTTDFRTTTASPTSTLTSTLASNSSSSQGSNTTVTMKATEYAEYVAAAEPTDTNTFPISVITISTCVPTVIYSVVTVTSSMPTEIAVAPTAIPSVASAGSAILYSSNPIAPVATSSPTTPIFTASAASLQGSVFLAVFAGLAAVLFV